MRHHVAPATAHHDGFVGQPALDEVEALPERSPPLEPRRDHAMTPKSPAESQTEALMRLRRLFAGIPTGIVSNDHETGVIEVNPAMVRMLARPAEEITPDNLQVWTHPDDHGTRILREEFDQDKRQSYDVEKRFIRGDGETIWCRVVVEDVHGDGPGRSSIAMFEDITERKLAELALRDHTDRLAQIIEIQRDVAAADLDDLHAVMDLICVRAQGLMGCDGAAVMMLEGDRLVFGADSGFSERTAGHEELRRSGLTLGSFTGWALLRNQSALANDLQNDLRADRETCKLDGIGSMLVVPLRHGERAIGVLQIVGNEKDAFVQEDVRTMELLSVVLSAAMSHASEFEAKRAEVEALGRLRAIFEGVSIGITRVNTEGRVLEANPAFEEMIGYSTAELQELPPGKITHPDDWGIHLALHDELMAGKRESYRYEKRYVRRGGEFVWCQLTAVLERDSDGRPSVVTTMIEDISERKEADDQLRQSQKMEAVGQLTAGIAHDFNNLLMGILGHTELALAKLGDDSPAGESLNTVLQTGQRAAGLVASMLAFGRRQSLKPRWLDLNQLVVETVALLARTLGEQIMIETSLAPDLPALFADPTQIQQVLFNLAINARDAMAQGGRLTLKTSDVALGADAAKALDLDPGRYLQLEASDTGCGMPEATLARIFDPFFTTKEVGQGTGLGLPSVYGIVAQSGGAVSVTSEVGSGSHFCVYLPVDETRQEQTPTPAAA